MKYLYYARPMKGCASEEVALRSELKDEYLPKDVKILDPFLFSKSDNWKLILSREIWAMQKADAVLINLQDAEDWTPGCIREISFAYLMQKPIFLVTPRYSKCYREPFITMASGIYESLEQALEEIRVFLVDSPRDAFIETWETYSNWSSSFIWKNEEGFGITD